jgi:hypothetical protein
MRRRRMSPLETTSTLSWTGHAVQYDRRSNTMSDVASQAGVHCRTKPSICHTLLVA